MMKKMLFAVALVAFACNDPAGPPPPVPTGLLHFVQQDSTAPPLLSDSASFYAKVGEDRRVELFYAGMSPGDTGEAFLQFEVRGSSLKAHPDGSPFLPGDSILITVSVGDPSKFDFSFTPTGLQFSPSDPARLHIEYNHSNHDFNGDGHEDSGDNHTESLLAIWRREPPDTVWTKIGTVRNQEFDEIEAAILSFSHYAVAW
jgi:hypothetical protein